LLAAPLLLFTDSFVGLFLFRRSVFSNGNLFSYNLSNGLEDELKDARMVSGGSGSGGWQAAVDGRPQHKAAMWWCSSVA
jgi:hypothetical protein